MSPESGKPMERTEPVAPALVKRAYARPAVTRYGSLADLTQGGGVTAVQDAVTGFKSQ